MKAAVNSTAAAFICVAPGLEDEVEDVVDEEARKVGTGQDPNNFVDAIHVV